MGHPDTKVRLSESSGRIAVDTTLRLESPEQCLRTGLYLWDAETQEQEDTGARFVATDEELTQMEYEGYRAAVLCFEAGLALNPNHAGLQSAIAEAYYFGRGVAQDLSLALTWFRRAADQADAFAQYSLGWMYAHGIGVRQDMQEALRIVS